MIAKRNWVRVMMTVLAGFTLLSSSGYAQEISQTHEMLIKEIARKKIVHYTRNLELLASTDRTQRDLIENVRARLYSMAESPEIRVYDDYTPPEVLEQSNLNESTSLLDAYLKNMHIFYPDNSLQINYADFETSDVFYDPDKNRFFIKVSANRQLKGFFHYKDKQIRYEDSKRIDFYLSAEVKDSLAKVGKIFEIDEHKENTAAFAKATIHSDAQTAENTRQIQDARENARPYAFKYVNPVYIRKKTYNIMWQGGSSYDLVQLELVSEKNKSNRIPLTSAGQNNGKFEWTVSPGLKPGIQYRFLLEDITKDEAQTYSKPFTIKRRIPLGAKIAGGLVVSASLAYVIYRVVDAREAPQSQQDLPLPPEPR
jgi:hypothetical protein